MVSLAMILATSGTSIADLEDGLVVHYPFNGNANDESGNRNDGTVYGAALSTDRFGVPNSAYDLDGQDDYIRIWSTTAAINDNINRTS